MKNEIAIFGALWLEAFKNQGESTSHVLHCRGKGGREPEEKSKKMKG